MLYAGAFRDDPVITYMLCNLTTENKNDYLETYFKRLLAAAGLNGGIFEEADDFSSAQVVVPPGKKVDNPWTIIPAGGLSVLFKLGWKGGQRMLIEYTGLTEAAKKKGLKGQKKFYYLFFIATRVDCQGRGLSSALIKKVQERAAAEGLPVWLESTTPKSHKIYEKLGFETIEKIILGKGVAGSDGKKMKNGEGVPIWAMVWWPPHLKKADT